MTWYPYGPNFVIRPRDVNFKRLSRRNEVGQQSLVSSITLDPTDPATIYIVTRPSSGGVASFRTRDDGETWTPITDDLQRSDSQVDPTTFAVHPSQPQVLYMGTGGKQAVYVSNDRGATWSPARIVGGYVRALIIDPRTAVNPTTTVLLAATDTGVYRSPDGGTTWTPVLPGDVWTLVCDMPATGTDHYYAGVTRSGVFHATTPTGTWTNLNGLGIGLPTHVSAPPAENFTGILLGICPRNPARLYALTVGTNASGTVVTTGLYTTGAPTAAWTSVAMTSPPQPAYGYYDLAFAVAPNSPGDGNNDVLFFGSLGVSRSTTSGLTWAGDAVGFHADVHFFEFFPPQQSSVWTSAAGGTTVPVTYMGCDGGLAVSDGIAGPTVDTSNAPPDWDQGLAYTDTWAWQNYNHGLPSVACYQFASDPGIAALGYLACQDTGLAAGSGGAVWRSLSDADHNSIAAARGAGAMHVWTNNGWWNLWSLFVISAFKDKGDYGPSAAVFATLGAGGSTMQANSPFAVGTDGKCLAGVTVRDSDRALNTAVSAPGTVTVTPASMAGIQPGTAIEVEPGVAAGDEMVTVTAVTATTFTATFAKVHAIGALLRLQRSVVARIDGDGLGTQISQDFGRNGRVVSIVAPSPGDPNTVYCATNDGRIWSTNAATTASSATVWTEISAARPAGVAVSSLAVDAANQLFALLYWPATASGITTPLFQVSTGTWSPISSLNLPPGPFGKLVADPIFPATVYASSRTQVYRPTPAELGWDWVDISENLPGGPIYDLWCGNIGSATTPTILLRAAIPTRGVFERNVTPGAGTPIGLYVRDNLADQGWLNPSPDGIPNPFDPGNPGSVLFHYMCADIRIDARQSGTAGIASFYQTDPEASTPPISPVRQESLKDNSSNLPQADSAMVHVQVHNRSLIAAPVVRVWAIYASAAAGVPALSASASAGNAFAFWSQFTVTGQIIPNLPADSPWKSVGPPQTLTNVDASHPQVGSWQWTVPMLPSGDPGHYCMVVFVHSATSPISETRMNVDEITPVNPQIGQKNLHIGAPLPPSPGPTPGPGGRGWPGDPGSHRPAGVNEEYTEFHNPTAQARQIDVVLDLRGLPPPVRAALRLSRVDSVKPLSQAITGVSGSHKFRPAPDDGGLCWLIRSLALFLCRLGNLIRALLGRSLRPCRETGDNYSQLAKTVYEAQPSTRVQVQGILLPPFASGSLLVRLHNSGQLEAGREYPFHVQQLVAGQVAGGSQFIVRVDGVRKQPDVPEGEDLVEVTPEELRRRVEQSRHLPTWIRDEVQSREREESKFG
jgi:hypothetical protein